MGFLNNAGLNYFYQKIKEIFVRSVNSISPVNGNVTITNVATADNLASPDAQASYGSFIYRTSGGNASLESGEAQLVYIDGNIKINGRSPESFGIETTNEITAAVTGLNSWRQEIDANGTYIFSYVKPTSNISGGSWQPDLGKWYYNNAEVNLSTYGIDVSNITPPSINLSKTNEALSVEVVPNIWENNIYTDGSYEFIYNDAIIDWMLLGETVILNTYGLNVTGSPNDGDKIVVNYIAGTPNSTVKITYAVEERGTIVLATPQSFLATGLNQFNKNTMYIQNASISNNTIVSETGKYLCYCKAKGGVTNGYVAYSESGAIQNIAWCENIPEIDDTVITDNQSITSELASITFEDDGYVIVVATNMDDLCIHPRWSGSEDTKYEAYTAPSIIQLPQTDNQGANLPLHDYGMPRLGAVADRLDLDGARYVQNIGRKINNTSNMEWVVAQNVSYDYDDNYIYYVLTQPNTYNITINGTYIVNDFGTEEFIGTEVALGAQILYGQNLRDKLRTDVVTLSEQDLSAKQRQQVAKNLQYFDLGDLNILPNETNFNDVTIPGVYAIAQNTQAETMSNLPTTSFRNNRMLAGTLRVWSGLGVERYKYYCQEYTNYLNDKWTRHYDPESGWSEWILTTTYSGNNSRGNYCYMPDGILIQWGIIVATSNFPLIDHAPTTMADVHPEPSSLTSKAIYQSTAIISFPMDFIDNTYSVNGTFKYSTGHGMPIALTSYSQSNCSVRIYDFYARNLIDGETKTISWQAIGRWK